jgi:hypothetical protein
VKAGEKPDLNRISKKAIKVSFKIKHENNIHEQL